MGLLTGVTFSYYDLYKSTSLPPKKGTLADFKTITDGTSTTYQRIYAPIKNGSATQDNAFGYKFNHPVSIDKYILNATGYLKAKYMVDLQFRDSNNKILYSATKLNPDEVLTSFPVVHNVSWVFITAIEATTSPYDYVDIREFDVFEYTSINKILFKNNQEVKKYDEISNSLVTIGAYPPTEEMFKSHGLDAEKLSKINKTVIIPNLELLYWTDGNPNKKEISQIINDFVEIDTSFPDSTEFLDKGMDKLSPLLDRRVEALEPMAMTNKSEILAVGDIGKVFSKTIDLKKYIDIRNIRTEVK